MLKTKTAVAVFLFGFLPLVVLTKLVYFGPIDLPIGLLLFGIASIVIGFAGTFRKKSVPRGRDICVVDSKIRQFGADGTAIAEIDASKNYHYQLEWVGTDNDAIIRLYQDDVQINFYLSDPGADIVRNKALRFRWPAPPVVKL